MKEKEVTEAVAGDEKKAIKNKRFKLSAKKKKRKITGAAIRRTVLMIVALVLILAVTVFVISFVMFRVTEITVRSTINKDKVIAVSGLKTGDPVIFLNKAEIENNIKNAYPYVTRVDISENFAGEVELRLHESTPVFYAKVYNKYITLTSDLTVLEIFGSKDEAVNSNEEKLTEFVTEDIIYAISGEMIKFGRSGYDKLVPIFIENLVSTPQFEEVSLVDVSSRFNYTIIYNNQLEVNLGKDKNTAEKMQFLEKISEKLDGEKGELDLSDVSKAYFIPNEELNTEN